MTNASRSARKSAKRNPSNERLNEKFFTMCMCTAINRVPYVCRFFFFFHLSSPIPPRFLSPPLPPPPSTHTHTPVRPPQIHVHPHVRVRGSCSLCSLSDACFAMINYLPFISAGSRATHSRFVPNNLTALIINSLLHFLGARLYHCNRNIHIRKRQQKRRSLMFYERADRHGRYSGARSNVRNDLCGTFGRDIPVDRRVSTSKPFSCLVSRFHSIPGGGDRAHLLRDAAGRRGIK